MGPTIQPHSALPMAHHPTLQLHSPTPCSHPPGVPCAMVWCILDSIGHRVHLAILHHQLHPQCGLTLCKLALAHCLTGARAQTASQHRGFSSSTPTQTQLPLQNPTSKSSSDSSMGRSLQGEGNELWPLSSSPRWWHT